MSDLTHEEFYRAIDGLRSDFREGQSGTHARLDKLNGRTLKVELSDMELRTELRGLKKIVYQRRRTDIAGEGEEWAFSLSKREGALMAFGLSVILALFRIAEFLGDKLWHALTAK